MKLRVHEFRMGDSEDVDIWVAEPIYEWQKTEKGRWVMSTSVETPSYHIEPDHLNMGYKVSILADIPEDLLTYYYLRWP